MLKRGGYDTSIEKFRPNISEDEKQKLIKLMRHDCKKYRALPDEFFLYHFDAIDEKKKETFLMDNQRGLYTSLLNEPRMAKQFRDKQKTYQLFGKYYKRAFMSVDKDTDDSEIIDFIKKAGKVIIKPAGGSMGKGISIHDSSEFRSTDEMLSRIRGYGKAVIEELITPDNFMKSLHPQSLNTVRVPTFLSKDGRVIVFHPVLRVGRGDSIVDNAGSGGIFAYIDAETGIVLTDGVDEMGNTYRKHPDTGFTYKGLQIPRWNELLELARNLAKETPTVRFIGFDLALTPDGWVMVEGNNNPQPLTQMVDQIGLKKEFDELMKQ